MAKICPNCKTENPDSAGFCLECGTKLNTTNTMKSNAAGNGFGDWWNAQGNGAKALVVISVCCVGLLLIVAIAGMLSPDKTTANTTQSNTTPTTTAPTTTTAVPATSNSSTTSSASGVQVKVSGSGSWSGSYGDTSGQQSVDGSGTRTFDMGSPDIVSAVFQKESGGSGTLTVEIIENGNVVETKSTSAAYGVVSASHSFY